MNHRTEFCASCCNTGHRLYWWDVVLKTALLYADLFPFLFLSEVKSRTREENAITTALKYQGRLRQLASDYQQIDTSI